LGKVGCHRAKMPVFHTKKPIFCFGMAYALPPSMNVTNMRLVGEDAMRKMMRILNWWLVTASFVVFATLEVVCVYYLMLYLGYLPK
jgi:hypothetical protein